MGKAHGTEKPCEEIEAENEGVKILLVIRLLGRPSGVKDRFRDQTAVASSVTSTARERVQLPSQERATALGEL